MTAQSSSILRWASTSDKLARWFRAPLRSFIPGISPLLRYSDKRLLRRVAFVIGAGFLFILTFMAAQKFVERSRVITAQRFEQLINDNFELGTSSQRTALLLFGMLNPRNAALQSKLAQEARREIQGMERAGDSIASQAALAHDSLSPDSRERLAAATERVRRFREMSRKLIGVMPIGDEDRALVSQFADQSGAVLAASRAAIMSLSADEVKSAQADEALKLVFFSLSMTAAILTGISVLLFVMFLLKPALESLRITEEQLMRANNDLESFSAIVAHDLNSPLDSIALRSKLLKKAAGSTPEIDESADAINREINRLGAMVQALLRLSRTGGAKLTVVSLDIPQLIDEVRSAVRDKLEASHGAVRYSGCQSMRGDRALLHSLFQNLVENSVRYRREESPPLVEIRSSCERNELQFIYEDNGRGIPVQERERVFEPFVQLKGEEMGHGAGLGLSLVKRIVQAHRGRIHIADREGLGARFVIDFPQPEGSRSATTYSQFQ